MAKKLEETTNLRKAPPRWPSKMKSLREIPRKIENFCLLRSHMSVFDHI